MAIQVTANSMFLLNLTCHTAAMNSMIDHGEMEMRKPTEMDKRMIKLEYSFFFSLIWKGIDCRIILLTLGVRGLPFEIFHTQRIDHWASWYERVWVVDGLPRRWLYNSKRWPRWAARKTWRMQWLWCCDFANRMVHNWTILDCRKWSWSSGGQGWGRQRTSRANWTVPLRSALFWSWSNGTAVGSWCKCTDRWQWPWATVRKRGTKTMSTGLAPHRQLLGMGNIPWQAMSSKRAWPALPSTSRWWRVKWSTFWAARACSWRSDDCSWSVWWTHWTLRSNRSPSRSTIS